MKSVPVRSTTGSHPADRILDIVNKLQQDAREADVRLQTLEDVRAEFQTKLNEANASIIQLQEQARAATRQWQEERARLEEQIAALNAELKTQAGNQADLGSSAEAAAAIVELERARVQLLIEEIDTKLADPSIDLSVEMRMRRERVELEAYLKGLRFSRSG